MESGDQHMTNSSLETIRKQASILTEMSGPGRGVIAEGLMSRLAAADPVTAELLGQLIGALEHHDPASLRSLGKSLEAQARATPTGGDTRLKVDVLIVAPKQIEEEAVLAAFEASRANRVTTRPSGYSGYLTETDNLTVLICSPKRDGNVFMSLFVSEWLREWSPTLAALVGMAGGRHPDVKPGDVVLANAILDYQIVRRINTPSGSVDKNRFVPYTPRPNIQTNFLSIDGSWAERMKSACATAMPNAARDKRLTQRGFRSWSPALKPGVVLAGSTLVEDGSIKNIADRIHDQAIAVEMEGAGFAGAMAAADHRWVSVRGIADMGGHPDYTNPDGKPRTKRWQFAATFAAASALRTVLPDISALSRPSA